MSMKKIYIIALLVHMGLAKAISQTPEGNPQQNPPETAQSAPAAQPQVLNQSQSTNHQVITLPDSQFTDPESPLNRLSTSRPAANPLLVTGGPTVLRLSPPVQSPPSTEPATNTFNFQGVDLNTFLTVYAGLVNRTILRPATLPQLQITFKTQTPLTRTEAVQAFDTVLAMNGIATIPVGDKFVKVVPVAQVSQEAARFSDLPPEQLPEAAQYTTHVVQLTYVKPSELVAVLQPFARIPNAILPIDSAQVLVIRDYAENVKRMLELIKQIDVAVPSEFVSEVIPIKYALATEIAAALSSLSAGGATATVGSGVGTTATRGLGTRTSLPRTGIGTLPGTQIGVPGATQFGTTPTAQPTTQPSFSDRLRNIIQRAAAMGEIQIIGPNKIIADERTNSLLVFASRQDMETIKDIIAKLDVVLPQVLIEALILEVSVGDQLDFGVSWLKRPETTGKFTYSGVVQNKPSFTDPNSLAGSLATNVSFASGLSWWGRYTGDFDVAASLAAQDSRVRVLSRPCIQTSHAVQANISIGVSRPIITGTYTYYGGPQTQYQYQNFGISLSVLPLINPDGLVVMDIEQQIQDVGREIKVDANFSMPEVTTRSANAKVAVRNRETVMLGGFISDQATRTKSGIPILKDIPLLGLAFSDYSRKNNRSELIVLIRPTVLPTPDIAAENATNIQQSLPLVASSQKEFEKVEAKSGKAARKYQFPDVDSSQTRTNKGTSTIR
jgi:general secretion pathway protein D